MNALASKLMVVVGLSLTAIMTGCAPSTFVRSPSGWKAIELREDLTANYGEAWQVVVDTIAKDHDIELLDKNSGYLRTAWQMGIQGGPAQGYRGRLVIKFANISKPDKVELKTDAEWFENVPFRGPTWVQGYDSAFQRDVYTALAGRLSRTVPSN